MTLIFQTVKITLWCLLVLFACLLALPWRLFVYAAAKIWRPELKLTTGFTRISGTLTKGRIAPVNAMTVLTVDGYMDLTEFQNLFDKRILQKRDRNGNPVFGKFYETITHFLGYPFFIKVKNFDLAKHIVVFDYHLEGIDCFDENHLKVYLSNLMNEPWVDGTSYWKVTLIHNYNDQAKTLIIMKWQHVLADGFAMRSVMDAVCTIKSTSDPLAGEGNVTKHKPLDNNSIVYIKLSQFWGTMKALIFFPYELAHFQGQAASHEINLWEKDTNAPNEEYYMNFTKPFPVAAIKSAQAKYSVGFQTLLFSAVSSALERTLKDCQQPVTENVLADCSRPVIPHPEGLTNSFYFGHICAPLFSSSKEVRLLETERSFRAHRVSNISMGLYYVMEMAAVLPSRLPWMSYSYLFQFVHIIFTSFPYYSTGVLLNNVPVSDSFTFFASPHRSADFITLVTGTASQIRFGLSIRKNVISLPPRFVHIIGEYIEEEMEQLCGVIKSAQAKYSVGFQTLLFSAVSSALERALKESQEQVTENLLADCSRPLFWSHLRTLIGHFKRSSITSYGKKLSSTSSIEYLNGFPYYWKDVLFNNMLVSDSFTLFVAPHRSADLITLVTVTASQIRFGLSFQKNVTSLPPRFVHILGEYIEEEMEQL
ncbi:unnamed protein product, partial [Allacma fusca]